VGWQNEIDQVEENLHLYDDDDDDDDDDNDIDDNNDDDADDWVVMDC